MARDLNTVTEPLSVLFGNPSVHEVLRMPELKWLQTASAGVDSLLLADQPFPEHVILTSGSGVYGAAGGEHVLGMMLYFARGFGFYFGNQRRGTWVRDVSHARLLKGRTLVIVGLGDVGRHIADRAKAFDMTIYAVKRTPGTYDGVKQVLTTDQLDEVLPLADHVAIALPLTRETRGLFDERRLSLMPRGSYLYNIGRGAVVDEDALIAALESGHLAGAGLDVFEEEPLPEGHPLWSMENVLITPHIGADTPWDNDVAAEIFMDNLERFVQGAPLRNVVDTALGY